MHAILLKKKTISHKEKRAMMAFLQWQVVVAVSLIVISACWFGGKVAQSVFFGALTIVVPNIVMAIYVFMRAAERSAKQVVRAFYVGEVIKIILIAVIMLFILHAFAVQMGPFLIGFMGTYLVYIFSPVILKSRGAACSAQVK